MHIIAHFLQVWGTQFRTGHGVGEECFGSDLPAAIWGDGNPSTSESKMHHDIMVCFDPVYHFCFNLSDDFCNELCVGLSVFCSFAEIQQNCVEFWNGTWRERVFFTTLN